MSGRVVSRIARSVGQSRRLRTTVGLTVVVAMAAPAAAMAGSSTTNVMNASNGPRASNASRLSSTSATSTGFASVRLMKPSAIVQVGRIPGEPIYADPGVYLASRNGAWQVDIRRPNYGSNIVATQVAGGSGPNAAVRPLPVGLVRDLSGLTDFFHVSVRNASGKRVLSKDLPFCPFGNDQRVNGTGPLNPTYPRVCYLNPFALGTVIGIDQGWATSALGYNGVTFGGPNGAYRLKLSITRAYRSFFDVPFQAATTTVTLQVKNLGGCDDRCPPPTLGRAGRPVASGPRGASSTSRGLTPAPDVSVQPPASTLPDLVALPAWNITTESFQHRDYLDFAASVWNRGPAPLLVEGFRTGSEPKMRAWQYFTNASGHISGRLRVGELHYDARPGHEHWHFEQFARYSLLDAHKRQIVRSEKEAFCLAPTDAIDMTVPRADWMPYSTGLATACGSQQSLWVREVLPTGWGDTYLQTLPGQSFDITDLANGTYYISIAANPSRVLYERDTSNDIRLRQITLGGTGGRRTVTVAPWHGITQ